MVWGDIWFGTDGSGASIPNTPDCVSVLGLLCWSKTRLAFFTLLVVCVCVVCLLALRVLTLYPGTSWLRLLSWCGAHMGRCGWLLVPNLWCRVGNSCLLVLFVGIVMGICGLLPCNMKPGISSCMKSSRIFNLKFFLPLTLRLSGFGMLI